MKTMRLSTNWTLILKIFIPIVWITFFFSFFLSAFLANPIEVPQFTSDSFRIGVILFILGGIVFFRFTFFRLKRVDADNEYVYVSSYFRTFRYTYESIDHFLLYDHLLFKAVHIMLKEKGSFGKRMIFIPKMLHFTTLVKEKELQSKIIEVGKK